VGGDLLDEFGGKGREVCCTGHVGCLILPGRVRHFWERLVCSFLVGGDEDGDDDVATTAAISSSRHLRRSLFVCLLLACMPVPSGRVGRLVSQSVYQVPAAKERRLSRRIWPGATRYTA